MTREELLNQLAQLDAQAEQDAENMFQRIQDMDSKAREILYNRIQSMVTFSPSGGKGKPRPFQLRLLAKDCKEYGHAMTVEEFCNARGIADTQGMEQFISEHLDRTVSRGQYNYCVKQSSPGRYIVTQMVPMVQNGIIP